MESFSGARKNSKYVNKKNEIAVCLGSGCGSAADSCSSHKKNPHNSS